MSELYIILAMLHKVKILKLPLEIVGQPFEVIVEI